MPLAHVRRGSGPPLVLIHGIGSQWQMWQPVLDRVSREREVVAVDLPGFGDSRRCRAGPRSRRSRTRSPSSSTGSAWAAPHVAGNSLGGAHRAGDGARRDGALGLRALPRRLREHARGHLRARGAARLAPQRAAPRPLRRARGGRPGAAHARVRPPRRAAVAHPRRRGRRRDAQPRRARPASRRRSRRSRDHSFGGRTLDCPVTVAWGEKDRLLIYSRQSAARAPAAARRPPRDAARLRPRPDLDDPEQVARVLLEASAASGERQRRLVRWVRGRPATMSPRPAITRSR